MELLKYNHEIHGNIILEKIGKNTVKFFSKQFNENYGEEISYKNKRDLFEKIKNGFHYHKDEEIPFHKYISLNMNSKKNDGPDLFSKVYLNKRYRQNSQDNIQIHRRNIQYFEINEIYKYIEADQVYVNYSIFLNEKMKNDEKFKSIVKSIYINKKGADIELLKELKSLNTIIIQSNIPQDAYNVLNGLDIINNLKVLTEDKETVKLNITFSNNIRNMEILNITNHRQNLETKGFTLSYLTNLVEFKTNLFIDDLEFLPLELEILKLENLEDIDLFVPEGVRKLHIGNRFKGVIDWKLHNDIEELKFGGTPIIEQLPLGLRVLKINVTGIIGADVLKNLERVLPEGLKELYFGIYTKVKISEHFYFPSGLETLVISKLLSNDKLNVPVGLRDLAILNGKDVIVNDDSILYLERLVFRGKSIYINLPGFVNMKEFHVTGVHDYNPSEAYGLISFGGDTDDFPKYVENLYVYNIEELKWFPDSVRRLFIMGEVGVLAYLGNVEQFGFFQEVGNYDKDKVFVLSDTVQTIELSLPFIMYNVPISLKEITPKIEDDKSELLYLRNGVIFIEKNYNNPLPDMNRFVKMQVFDRMAIYDDDINVSEYLEFLITPENYKPELDVLPENLKEVVIPGDYFDRGNSIATLNPEIRISGYEASGELIIVESEVIIFG